MSYPAMVFRVMIATPGDVQTEPKIIREVIHEWNAMHSERARAVLLPVGWKTHSAPVMGDRPQEILNRQILRDCDLLVAVFWTRLGTDTGKAPSGTVEEIQEHLSAEKPAMLYFSKTPVIPESVDQEQYSALKAFKAQCMEVGLIEEYGSPEQFRDKFRRHLQAVVREHLQPGLPEVEALREQDSVRTELSEEAKKLLLTAVAEEGQIICVRTFGGLTVKAKTTALFSGREHREEARWLSAVEELQDARLIQDRGHKGEVFEVTKLGYEVADQLA